MAIRDYILAFLSALAIGLMLAYPILIVCKKLKVSQTILHYVDKHAGKSGTPTMGGWIFILSGILASCIFIFFRPDYFNSLLVLLIMLGYGILGFLDDFIKIRLQNTTRPQKMQISKKTIRACLTIIFRHTLILIKICFAFIRNIFFLYCWNLVNAIGLKSILLFLLGQFHIELVVRHIIFFIIFYFIYKLRFLNIFSSGNLIKDRRNIISSQQAVRRFLCCDNRIFSHHF